MGRRPQVLMHVQSLCITLWQYIAHPRRACSNTVLVIRIFWAIVYFGFLKKYPEGRGVVFVLRAHRDDWSTERRGKYVWKKAAAVSRWALRLLDIDLEVRGKDLIRYADSCIIVPNHQSLIDVLLVNMLVRGGRFVCKQEIESIPVISALAQYGGQIFVRRGSGEEAHTSIREGVAQWPTANLIVFPEGARSLNGMIGRFKSGAFRAAIVAHLPIIPVSISGCYNALPKGSLLKYRKGSKIIVRFGDPVFPGLEREPTDESINELRVRAREQIVWMFSDTYISPLPR